MCRDFLRLGYSRMVVDPGVRLAYTADVARQLYTQKVPCSALIMHKSIEPQAGGAHGDMQVQTCCTAPLICAKQEAAASSLKALQAVSAALVRLAARDSGGEKPYRSRFAVQNSHQEGKIDQRPGHGKSCAKSRRVLLAGGHSNSTLGQCVSRTASRL